MSILPSFYTQTASRLTESKVIVIPKEFEVDFDTGELTGSIAEGLDAIKVWIWLCLKTERFRYPIFSWNYGVELEQYIGETVTDEYLQDDCRAEIEEALTINPLIEGIDNFSAVIQKDKLSLSFTVNTALGEVEVHV